MEGTLGAEPTDYEVKIGDSVSNSVSAAFRKTLPDEGTLKLEILADGEVVAERETSAESSSVAASWSPQSRGTRESFKEELSKDTAASQHH